MTTKSKRPTHNIYVVQGEGETARWVKIGAAWPNQDGKGFNVALDASPLFGRIVMRTVKEPAEGGQQ